MKLQEFVTEALTQVLKGVADVQPALHGENQTVRGGRRVGFVNPPPQRTKSENYTVSQSGELIHNVEFDVAVTAKQAADGRAGIEVFGMGLGGGLVEANESVSRVKFSVPVEYPRVQERQEK